MRKNLKILLLRPKPKFNVVRSHISEIDERIGISPPIGLASIAAVLEQRGFGVSILDAYALDLNNNQIKKEITRENPQVIGIPAMTHTLESSLETALIAKNSSPDSLIILGGPHMSVYPKETLQVNSYIDLGVYGEGELTFLEICKKLSKGEDFGDVKGTVVRSDGGVVLNSPRPLIENLDILPLPARHLLPNDKYSYIIGRGNNLFTTMITSRGCPFNCAYCYHGHWGKKFRAFSAKYVANEIESCLSLGIREIRMYDDTFTLDRKRVFDLCDEIVKRKLDVRWTIRTRPDLVDRGMIVRLAKARCERIQFGVESGDQKILDDMGRKMTLKQIKDAFRYTKDAGIETYAYFMVGYLGGSKKTIKKTVNFAKELDPNWTVFQIATILPKTKLYEEALSEGLIRGDPWGDYVLKKTNRIMDVRLPGKDYTTKELDQLEARAYLKFYLRPKIIYRKIREINSLGQFRDYVGGLWGLIRANT